MSSRTKERVATVHSHQSNRAKNRQGLERKAAFKPCLSNPFQIEWSVHSFSSVESNDTNTASRPSVPVNVQNAVLSRLILSLEGVAAHHASRSAHARGEKRQGKSQQTGPNKRRKTASGNEGGIPNPITTPDEPMDVQTTDQETVIPAAPPIIPHLILGINRVTKRLEDQARAYRQTLTATKTNADDDGTPQPQPSGPISVVFVCRADVDPPLLISHLPTLIASCNSSRNALTDPNSYPPIKLVPVPKGSESLLADATGLRRLAVLALDVIVLVRSAAI